MVKSCYTGNKIGFLTVVGNCLKRCEAAHMGSIDVSKFSSPLAAASATLESVMFVLPLVMGNLTEDMNTSRDSALPQLAEAVITTAMIGLFNFDTSDHSGSIHTQILLLTSSSFIGSCSQFVISRASHPIDGASGSSSENNIFGSALSFLFRALTYPNTDVSTAAAKSILKLTLGGKSLLLIPYVDEMNILQTMISLLCPLLIEHRDISSTNEGAILTVLEAIVRLLVQLPPKLADSYISSLGGIILDQLRTIVESMTPADTAMQVCISRLLKQLSKIIKFCDVLFMPPIQSSHGSTSLCAQQNGDILVPLLVSVWKSLAVVEQICLS